MFSSFRRRHQKKQDRGGPPYIRASPSLPELHAQGIPWPEDLIDAAEIPGAAAPTSPAQGASLILSATSALPPTLPTRCRTVREARRRADILAVHVAPAIGVRQAQVDALCAVQAEPAEEPRADVVQRYGASCAELGRWRGA